MYTISSISDLFEWVSLKKDKVITYTIESANGILSTTNSMVVKNVMFHRIPDKCEYINISGIDATYKLDTGTNLSINNNGDCEIEINYFNRYDIYQIKTDNITLYIN